MSHLTTQQLLEPTSASEGSEETFDLLRNWQHELEQNWSGGYTQMPDEIRHNPTLSPRAKMVYEALLSFMWFQSDRCWPSQETLAKATGYSVRTVIRALNDLYERGYIERWKRGQGQTNYYFINPFSFVRSFAHPWRGKRLLLQSTDPILHQEVRDPHTVSGPCQLVTSEADRVSDQALPVWQTNQTKPRETQGKEKPSNDSTPSETEGHGKTIRNTQGTKNPPPKTNQNHKQPPTQTSENQQENHTDPRGSKRAKAVHAAKLGGAEQLAIVTGIAAEHLEELGIAPERKKRTYPDWLVERITSYAADLGENPASLKGGITRAVKLYYFGCQCIGNTSYGNFQEDPEGVFLELLKTAKKAAQHVTNPRYRTGSRFNRMPAFYADLERQFGLSEEEKVYLRSDDLLFAN